MSQPLLHDQAPPDATTFVLCWLLPYVQTLTLPKPAQLHMGSDRWTAESPLPYWLVTRVAGADDGHTDYPVVRVHYFDRSKTLALRGSASVHRRMLVLVNNATWPVTMPDGRLASCSFAETLTSPHEEPYGAESVVSRVVSEYRLGLPFAPT